jgi:hypothetical protein
MHTRAHALRTHAHTHSFVNTHAPWYNSNKNHQGDGEAQRLTLEPMFYAAGVDAVFAGHVRVEQKTLRLLGGLLHHHSFS